MLTRREFLQCVVGGTIGMSLSKLETAGEKVFLKSWELVEIP